MERDLAKPAWSVEKCEDEKQNSHVRQRWAIEATGRPRRPVSIRRWGGPQGGKAWHILTRGQQRRHQGEPHSAPETVKTSANPGTMVRCNAVVAGQAAAGPPGHDRA
ncbi:hypothetical protein SCUP234_05835 [Seiridium cupressi]|uniref:Uncharacterized protein n=1 Tax=Seiridium unicorne TaxID=138068 RepID=A0ABR2UNG8_9PEZI